MQISTKGINLIKEFEGFMPNMYKDQGGKLTIGYGHLIKDAKEKSIYNDVSITIEEATDLLYKDVEYFANYINSCIDLYQIDFNQNQFDALCSFCFNLGHFENDMIERFKDKNIKAIGNALLLYNKIGGKISNGLIRRRKAEHDLYFTEVKKN